jgi:hypothetical protein
MTDQRRSRFRGNWTKRNAWPQRVHSVGTGAVPPMAAAAPYGRLTVVVQKAEGKLVKSDPLGKPDPYVRLSFGEDTVKTDHIAGTEIDGALDDAVLEWRDEQLELALPSTRTALRVELVDHDPVPGTEDDDVMAEGYVDLAPLILAWAQQPEPEMDYVSEHLRRVDDEGTMVAALTTLDTTQRGTKIEGGQFVSLTIVVKLDLPEPGLQPVPPTSEKAQRSRANLAEEMSVLDFACLAMSTTRSLPLRLDDEEIIHPELQHPNLPKMCGRHLGVTLSPECSPMG